MALRHSSELMGSGVPCCVKHLHSSCLANATGQDWHIDNLAKTIVSRGRFRNVRNARNEADAVVDVGQFGGFRVGLNGIAGCVAGSGLQALTLQQIDAYTRLQRP